MEAKLYLEEKWENSFYKIPSASCSSCFTLCGLLLQIFFGTI